MAVDLFGVEALYKKYFLYLEGFTSSDFIVSRNFTL